LRFNSADSAYLNRTPASAGNRRKWTWSGWVKRSASADQKIFCGGTGTGSTDYIQLFFGINDTLRVSNYVADLINTTSVYRDYSAWYHIVWVADTDNATAANRMQLYVNNTLVATANVTGDLGVNQTQQHSIGSNNLGAYFGGYMTEINFINDQALTPSSFGETNAQTGVWQPKAYSGSYGTNGFYLNFSDNSNTTAATLGKDYSGNGNNWTPNNFSVTAGAGNDSLVDSPTSYGTDTGVGGTVRGNYETLNPLGINYENPTYSNGNLEGTATGGNWSGMQGTMGVATGKWYWEVTIGGSANMFIGIARTSTIFQTQNPQNLSGVIVYYMAGGTKRIDGTETSYGAGCSVGDVIGVALDLDANTVTFYRNNSSQGAISIASSTLSGNTIIPLNAVAVAGTSSICNFGQRPFAYTAPSGFKALCTQNLPTPTIGATATTLATQYFNPVIWTGNGASSRTITGVGFQPDLNWTKQRSGAVWNELIDAVRGTGKTLYSNATNAEVTNDGAGYISAFTSDGFTATQGSSDISGYNTNGATYVAWNWRASGTTVSNTSGSITSTVSANTTSGFSVVTWTGNGSDVSVGHGLGVAPSMVIHKFRSAVSNWSVYTSTTGAGKRLKLNSTDAVATDGSFPTTPTSTVFYINGGSNDNGVTMVAYCFAEVAGYSKFGSYTGNGSTNGPFVFCGFKPAFLMIKRTDASSNAWMMYDGTRNTSNLTNKKLAANLSVEENNGADLGDDTFGIDFLSNGFKSVTQTGTNQNASGGTYIFMAFASTPFKYSLAR
jgi:hypothetical protein